MESSSKNPKSCKDILFILGSIILCISFVALVFASVVMFWKYPKLQKTYLIEMNIVTDSTGVWNDESKKMADSIVNVVANQNNVLNHKYEHILQLQEDKESLFTFGGVILSIVISVFGFFGYRSFNSIEDTAISNAEGMARKKLDEEMVKELTRLKNTLNSTLEKKIQDTKENEIPKIVDDKMTEHYDNNINAKLQYLNSIKETIDNLINKVDEHDKFYNEAKDAGVVSLNEDEENSSVEILSERKKGGQS